MWRRLAAMVLLASALFLVLRDKVLSPSTAPYNNLPPCLSLINRTNIRADRWTFMIQDSDADQRVAFDTSRPQTDAELTVLRYLVQTKFQCSLDDAVDSYTIPSLRYTGNKRSLCYDGRKHVKHRKRLHNAAQAGTLQTYRIDLFGSSEAVFVEQWRRPQEATIPVQALYKFTMQTPWHVEAYQKVTDLYHGSTVRHVPRALLDFEC